MWGASGCGVIIITVPITKSCTGVGVCRLDVPLDFVSPRVSGHHQMDERLSSSSMACTYSSSLVRPQGRHHHCLDGNTVDEHSGAQIVAPASASTAHDDGLRAEPGKWSWGFLQ
jgi:hypothetical protein